MKARDVVIGLIVLIVLVTGVILLRNSRNKAPGIVSPTPSYQQVESKFPGLAIPQNADKTSLNPVAGGQGMGEAWRTLENGKFSISVIANLPTGSYQAWVVSGTAKILLGRLTLEKGGYILNYSSAKDLSSYKEVAVTSGSQNVLTGSF